MRPAPCRNVEWRDSCAGLAQASPAAVSSLVRQSRHFQKTLFTPVPTSGSYSFPILSSLMVSEPCGNVCDTDVPNVAGNSIDSYSLYFDQRLNYFCVSCHLLHKETSPMRSESCTDLWIQRYGFVGLYHIQSDSYRSPNSLLCPT